MPDESAQNKPRPGEKPDRNPKTAAMAVVLVIVAVIGVVAFMNKDRLLVKSDVSTPTAQPSATTEVANTPPEIIALVAASDRIQPFSICEIECEAVDPDGDVLTYNWTVSAGDIFGEGPRIEWGSPIAEGLYRISVVVDDGRGGTAEHSLPLRVKENRAPVIPSMSVDADWVAAGESVRVSCEVSDPDGDEVVLTWTVTGGTVTGQGSAIIWTAPEEDGVYWIAVFARDAYGGEARRTVPISVSSGEPPQIDGMFVHGVNTDMLQKAGNDWMIYQGRSATIVCAVADQTAAYTYEWSADFGTLTADGATATWVAPTSRAGATIMVLVTDEYGNQSSASVLIYVETCTCSF
jgi:hypothetical protein